ncbi:IS256 family transposase [Alkalihalobacillus sp. AL-G]|uniref:IS256 family transposase n=1 Tax=Alkalihalobacillus sp. AL-G TaxID=2926399 RepID=UPI00272B8452|nr:IS256 family transposase [Alkalihalobacillus sp. AL-G]WLD93526.1 IS256 family transposase [Alkalihalobacillus sp. AL-G]WLD94853.1 IS256 family transposase [Alkalihalobacillus sp. AL-G]
MSHFNTENLDLATLLKLSMQDILKEKVEMILREEIKNVLKSEPVGENNARNGYYSRTLDTMYGRIEDMDVPRDRKGDFQTAMFEPYQRRMVAVDELIIQLYQHGVGVRQVGKIMKSLLGDDYSQGTISNITSTVMEDVVAWQKRPLKKRYCALFLDALFVKVRRDTVGKEAVYIVLGITPEGHREILGFYVGGIETSNGWREILDDLRERGVEEVLLGVFDGLPGLEEAFRTSFPKADVQRCIVHKVRTTLNKVRKKDQAEFSQDLKEVYSAESYEEAEEAFNIVKGKWKKRYSRELKLWEEELSVLLTFLNYPKSIRKFIYTTNLIERTNKEVRKRLKTMNSLPNIEAAEKIIYLTAADYNERWARRKLAGFNQALEHLQKLFIVRYGSDKIEG